MPGCRTKRAACSSATERPSGVIRGWLSGAIGGAISYGRAAGLLVTAPLTSPLAAILIDFFQAGRDFPAESGLR